jgi:hypothetical protein
MNELREAYDPESYFLNKTRSVYVNLDGLMLRMQTTSSKVAKRAVCGETLTNVAFNDQRMYDLTGERHNLKIKSLTLTKNAFSEDAEITILPKELCRKRYWSKKYPLCLSRVKLISLKRTNNNLDVSASAGSSPSSSSSLQNLANHSSNNLDEHGKRELDSSTLILFARTDREKEEWFKLFKKSAARKLLDSSHYLRQMQTARPRSLTKEVSSNGLRRDASNLTSTGHIIKMSYNPTSDKLTYKVIDETSSSNTLGDGEKDSSKLVRTSESSNNVTASDSLAVETQTDAGLLYDSSLNFMNTFLIRAFADFFTHKQWISLIKNKIQNKLTKIKVPYFMEELRILDLDMGSVIPLIKQVSEPWYDERGLWVHFEIDYSGGLQMSLSTKLNLMKLKSSSSSNSSPSQSNATFSFKSLINDEENLFSTSPKSSQPIEIHRDAQSEDNSPRLTNTIVRKKKSAIQHSDEEDSPESSGDEYVHSGFNDEENKLIET